MLEDEENLKHTMEKVVRSSATSSVTSAVTGVNQSSPGAKEINYVLRVLGPAACRNAELFKEVATSSLHLAITPQLKRSMIENGDMNLPPNYAQIVKPSVAKPAKPPPVAKQVHGVVCDLLNVLCASDSTARTIDRGIFMSRSDSQMLGELGRALGQVGDLIAGFSGQGAQQNLAARQLPAYTRQLTGEDVEVEEMALGTFMFLFSFMLSNSFILVVFYSQLNCEHLAKRKNVTLVCIKLDVIAHQTFNVEGAVSPRFSAS